jgi:hypothetical protein
MPVLLKWCDLCVMVDYTDLIVHESGDVAFPQRRPILRGTIHFDDRNQKKSQDWFHLHATC